MDEGYFLHFLQSEKGFLLEEETIAGISKRSCNLNLTDYLEGPITNISRRHFKIFAKDQQIFIEDLGSTNGTKVNHEPLRPYKPRRLFKGDTIELAGNEAFKIQYLLYKTGVIIPHHRGAIYFKEDEGTFYVNDKPIHEIPPIIFDLLKHLYDNLNKVCFYDDINKDVWGGGGDKNTIRAAIYKLRQKLDESSKGAGKRYIKTSQSYGYKLIIK